MNAWARAAWKPGGGDALLSFVVYGEVDLTAPLPAATYRTSGLPAGLEVRAFTRSDHAERFRFYEESYAWEQLVENDAALAARVEQSSACLVLQGVIPDPPSLEYLRDAIGRITFFLDHGGLAVYDVQIMKWWSADAWRRDVFEPDDPEPQHQTVILYSHEEDGLWFHTRGMRKFGRPDVSVRRVEAHQFDAVAELCGRFIAHQVGGAIVPDGQIVRMDALEHRAVVRYAGDYEDFDFNNIHFEVEWLPT